ncbi:MAG: pseudouridine synthase [Erysipelotrichaceae bacterium]|nr:pseudouridine synthase [Erysipelotrichaceae bacterium]
MFTKSLYRILMKNGIGNYKTCKTLIKHEQVKVNQLIMTNCNYKVQKDDIIEVNGHIINSHPYIYIMMNKPKGYICSNVDEKYPSVLNLIDRDDCYCVGRLDQDTTGLLIITNDQSFSKRLLLPQNKVYKYYKVETLKPIDHTLTNIFKQGVIIDQNYRCSSSVLTIIDDYHCIVKINEGKYHQIKKMFMSCHNQVASLKRIQFHHLSLDPLLKMGEYRLLTDEEMEKLL